MFAVLLRVQVATPHSLGDFDCFCRIGAISMAKLEKIQRENFIVFCLGDVIKINLNILLRWAIFQKEGIAITLNTSCI